MNKKILQIFTLTAACLIFPVSAHSQEDMKFVSADPFVRARRAPAVFRHDEPNELAGIEECNGCHHISYFRGGKKILKTPITSFR